MIDRCRPRSLEWRNTGERGQNGREKLEENEPLAAGPAQATSSLAHQLDTREDLALDDTEPNEEARAETT